MVDIDTARRLALALPEATEQDHHGFPSFRVAGRIFATLPDDAHLRIMLGPEQTAEAVARFSEAVQELHWGRRLRGVTVLLPAAPADAVEELLADAWQAKAPARLR
jgi:hypothetical protein